jgi:hypothetical protein
MHLATQLTRNIEIGAVRVHNQDSLEIVTTDGGKEVRNLRASNEARRWEISIATTNVGNSALGITAGDTTNYDSVTRMWADTNRGLDTFQFYDFIAGELVKVRFDSPLQITAPAAHLRHIDTFTLKEVLGE